MAQDIETNPEYGLARELMERMVENSQRPGEGNLKFVETIGSYLTKNSFEINVTPDPEYHDRALLVVEIGDPKGEQVLAAISHSDVVGIEGQNWLRDPWKLTEEDDRWFGRGVCDTHGSGVAMLLAGRRPEVIKALKDANKRVSIIFTSDEEAAEAGLSYRGAKLAAGKLGTDTAITARYFIAGEPTEIDGNITAMRSHKGRWLAHVALSVEHSGHAADDVQNAFGLGADIIYMINQYGRRLRYDAHEKHQESIFSPGYSTVQVTAATVKQGDFSTTPDFARFTIDLRMLPEEHDLRIDEIQQIIATDLMEPEVKIGLEVIDEFRGTTTRTDSQIVKLAEAATSQIAKGFNGGDEGEVLRTAGKEGVTIGPGQLKFAHMPNEEIEISSVFKAADIYSYLFSNAVELNNVNK